MSVRIFIENPPPFKQVKRRRADGEYELLAGSMEEGAKVCSHYLAAGVRPDGFHHSDLDPFESAEIRGGGAIERFDTFDYARYLSGRLRGWPSGRLVPHHIGVYKPAREQVAEVEALEGEGLRDVVVVGKPHRHPPGGAEYKATSEEVLQELSEAPRADRRDLGAIAIHLRPDEPERIASKFQAAGGRRLRLMGQFLDEVDSLESFLARLADTFDTKGLDLRGIEYNVGLAIFGLKNRQFYARLLRKEQLACETRFALLHTREQRLEESVQMNLEFADRAIQAGRRYGVNIGFSIQPLIEHLPSGRIHPAVDAAIDLTKRLQYRYDSATTRETARAS